MYLKIEYVFSKPGDVSFGQSITQTALPHCIVIDILQNRKKDNYYNYFLPICLTNLMP